MSKMNELVSHDVADAARRRARKLRRVAHRTLLRYPHRVRCPVCGWSGARLSPSAKPRRPSRLCPACKSSERYRALELVLRRRGPVDPDVRLLEVAPIHTVQRTAEDLGYRYTSVDLRSPRAQVHADLCHLPFADASFDVVVCFHVLEHIPEDRQAVTELARVVGTEGEAIVVVPRDDRRAVTFEDPDADTADYERLFGQSDHVRWYGADVAERWRETGVEVVEQRWSDLFTPDIFDHAALLGDDDRFWIVRASS